MRYRSYGASDIPVSEIGFGAWQLGNQTDWSPMAHDDAIELVRTALADGCTFFDTAPGYGAGRSETLLGEALEGRRAQVVINTKAGHPAEGGSDFSPDGIRRSVEASLTRLRTSYVDSVILHNPPAPDLHGDSPPMRTLEALKSEGVIRAYGASVDSQEDMATVLNTSGSEVLEVLFNIFFQDTGRLFPEARRRGVALIVKVPLDSGWLAGQYNETTRFTGVRARWTPSVIARRTQLVQSIGFVRGDGSSMTQAALRFILAHDAVTTVIPGARTVEQWKENASASDAVMARETVERLQRFWTEHLASDPLPW
jgi:aryl-alcohol dehydrogenase-like predicted oxidoreductase